MAETKGNRAAAKKMMAAAEKEIEVSDKDLEHLSEDLRETKEFAKSLQDQINAHAEEIETLRLSAKESSEANIKEIAALNAQIEEMLVSKDTTPKAVKVAK